MFYRCSVIVLLPPTVTHFVLTSSYSNYTIFLNYCLLDIIAFGLGLNTVSVVSINVTINAVLFSSDLPSSCHGTLLSHWLFLHRLSYKFLTECVAVKYVNCKDSSKTANVVLSYVLCHTA